MDRHAATGRPYLGELRRFSRPLLAACAGLVGGTMPIYLNNLFSASLIAEFGWSRAEFALIGMTTAIAVIFLPIVGRLADRYGMRRVAAFGVLGLPLILAGLALQSGSFAIFFLLSMGQMLIVSALAGIVVYGRLIVAYFTAARGLALGIASCAPALTVMLFSPLLSRLIEARGWRAGYAGLAVCVAVLGLLALALVPRTFHDVDRRPRRTGAASEDYRELFRSRDFIIILAAMLLCNIQFTVQSTQLTIIVGAFASDRAAAVMISVFAFGVIVGRLGCGLALDRFRSKMVATACFLVPALGLGVLTVGPGGPVLGGLAVLGLGFSVGAEGDIAAYLATRYFRPELFSTALGLFTGAMAASALIGAFLVNRTLTIWESYTPFLGLASLCVFVGAISFQLLGRERAIEPAAAPEAVLV